MAFINVAIKDAKETETVPEGEYDLQIVKFEDKDSKKGNPMTAVVIAIRSTEYPNASPLNHFLLYPSDKQTESVNAMWLRDLARFLQVFQIANDGTGFDTDDLAGAEGTCYLVQEEGDDGQMYNKLRLPRLEDEPEEAPPARGRASSTRRR